MFIWSEQGGGVVSGHPGPANSIAAAMLSYDVPHRAPWGWPVSLYIWTKAIAAGSYLVAASLAILGRPMTRTVPLLSAVFLALTFLLLIGDLEHPRRFYMILTRPQWRSWLVRGGVILGAFSAVIGIEIFWSPPGIAFIGIPLAIAAGTYTAFLFAQAKARDLWQNPLLPVRHFVQCIVAGSAALIILGRLDVAPLLMISAAAHLALIIAEVLTPHPTAHARLAVREMIRGKYRLAFSAGLLLQLLGIAALLSVAQALLPALLILAGVFSSEHAHVGAGQAVPLS
jgi:predicted membrane protein